MDTVLLREYEESRLSLTPEDARFIAAGELGRKIQIWRSAQSDEYILNPEQHVGVAQLPSGRLLEIQPKVPVENIFYMLAKSVGASWTENDAQLNRFDDILELIAELFADEAEQIVAGGLHRTYQEKQENLSMVRGRIDFSEDLRLNSFMRHKTYCKYDELTLDIPENQVIFQTSQILNGWGFSNKELSTRLSNIGQSLSILTPTNFTGSVVEEFIYNRMTEHYRPIHRLCQLLLDGASLSEHSGSHDNPAFIVDMNVLFEKFITQSLQENIKGSKYSVEEQFRLHLDKTKKYLMRPDIVLRDVSQVALVADCKYKKLTNSMSSHADMYQVLSYCIATASHHGILIYPLHEAGDLSTVPIINSSTVIRQMTIDLGGSIDDLITATEYLAQNISNILIIETAA